jgi:ABC-type antimicrobial peptide transport system permease subunit
LRQTTLRAERLRHLEDDRRPADICRQLGVGEATYGTMAFFVARQVRTIGVRMALGASPSAVMGSVLWDALRRVALGVVIGWAGAWAASKALESFVFGIRPTDPTVYVAVGGFIGLVGFAAALVPALRAARVDPLTALRHE